MKSLILTTLSLLFITACSTVPQTSAPDGIMQIDEKIWRSAQPDHTEIRQLQRHGIRHIVSLRRFHSDENIIHSSQKNESIPKLHHIPMRAGNIEEHDLFLALSCIQQCDGPTLVHCWHGADRTGAVIAAYRMVYHSWSAEKAIAELHDPRFGHHANVYPNIEKLLRELDASSLRRQLFATEIASTRQTETIRH